MRNYWISILFMGFLLCSCGNKELNLLIIHTDQQSQWTVGAYGMDELRGPLTTPNIDALAEDGVMFRNFFTNSAVCSPSRALMMTGCYATRNGVFTNNNILNRIPTLADHLSEAGYKTGYAGKWHLSGEAKPGWAPESYGWQDNRFMFNRGHYKKISESDDGNPEAHPYKEIGDEKSFTTDWLADKTIEFIREHKNEKFAYMVSFPDPHQPWAVREPFNSMYNSEELSVPQSYPQRFHAMNSWHQKIVTGHKNLTANRLRGIKAMYSGSVHLIDYNVGRIVDELKTIELFDKTLIVFTSDHGEYMGEHGMLYKNQFFETAYRLPLIIHIPDGPSGLIKNEVFSMVDFMPGILGLLGLESNEEVHGHDFSTILQNDYEWNNIAQVHHAQHAGVGVFTPEYYLILHKSGEHLLFNRKLDPNELYNLYYDPEFSEVVDSLSRLIYEHHREFDTPEHVWLQMRE